MLQLTDLKRKTGNAEGRRFYEFGDFRIDVLDETLSRNGEKLNINRRTFQVLQLLVEVAGEIVTKQEFFDTVWADSFVEDNNLTVAITVIRKALGDDARQARFIENLPRKGYRFIGKVELADPIPTVFSSEPGNATTQTAAGGSVSIFKKQEILTGVLAASLLVLLTFVVFNYRAGPRAANSPAIVNQLDSIGILPFVNQNPDTEYLSDGLTDSLINNLAELQNLRVIGQNSISKYKHKEINSADVGRELNVRMILTGRMVQEGDDLVVSAELTDVASNSRIWAQQYSRNASEVLGVQQEILQALTERLRNKLTGDEQKRFAPLQTSDPEAYLAYLRGRYYWNKRTNEDLEKAVQFFHEAIDKDPTFALAYVGLANCYLSISVPYIDSMQERASMVNAAAQKALEIDPNIGEAHATLAINHHFNEWKWAEADNEYRLAIELSPGYATAHHWYAEFLATEGRFDESFAEYHRALELDPLSLSANTDLGLNYYYAHRPDEGIQRLTTLKQMDAHYPRTFEYLATIYEEKGMFEEAVGEYAGVGSPRATALKNAFETGGAKAYWRRTLKLAIEAGNPNPYLLAKCYVRIGDIDKAFEFLEKSYEVRGPLLVWLKVSPEFDSIRSDPRFVDLMQRVGPPL